MKPRLYEKFKSEIIPAVVEKFAVKNSMAVPRLEKIVVNMGVGEAIGDIKLLEEAIKDMTTIAGQKPVTTYSRQAISNFKLRKGVAVGCKVTLRRSRMYEFMDRMINVALPRIRDFNGVPTNSFDQKGNYSMGIKDQTIFAEIDMDKLQRTQGMDITFVFNHGPKEQTFEVLRLFGMPFAHKERKS